MEFMVSNNWEDTCEGENVKTSPSCQVVIEAESFPSKQSSEHGGS